MILKLGSKGPQVIKWQRFIHVKPDGDFGKDTDKETRAWQKAHDLTADGRVGPGTLKVAKEQGFGAKIVEKPIDKPAEQSLFDGTDRIARINAAILARVAPALGKRVVRFIAAEAARGQVIQVVQGLRTFAEQDRLFAQRPRVTKARGGQSNHNYGMAVDVAPVISGRVSYDTKYYKFKDSAEIAGLEWGGLWKSFTDLPHLQLPNVPKPSILLDVYKQVGLAGVWKKYGGL
jgi:hypothetical protein